MVPKVRLLRLSGQVLVLSNLLQMVACFGLATGTTLPATHPHPHPQLKSTMATSSPTTAAATSTATTTTTTTAQRVAATATTPVGLLQEKSTHFEQRVLTRLEEKLESLSCDLLPLPTESRLWKGNETQEVLLPITLPSDCAEKENEEEDCDGSLSAVSWEGRAEMQSGDILLVRIDEARLIREHNPKPLAGHARRQPETAVYQVTRPGHAHCDVTEGVILDMTPLMVDGRRIVTLYDKDLTEGVNFLIVVSEKWGDQCVRLRVLVKSDNCGDNQECSSKGVCFSNISMEGYECQCCPGYVGSHCEEKDACFPSPCKNNGICVDISQGHDGNIFQCLCPYGFHGKVCEEESNPCDSSPCLNGATCSRNVTSKQFHCECKTGYTGALCQHGEQCASSPCVHGICVNEEGGYRCFCQPGFAGQQCQNEYHECESSPCINGGTCMDHIDDYLCVCGRGFTGKRCHDKVDLCDPNPCHNHHFCLDHGNNYSCACATGFSGPDCLTPSSAACSVNPCRHGGTCWSSLESFYCACRPGYTGKTCRDKFVIAALPSSYSYNVDNQVNTENPNSDHLDHLHNLYIATGTLACAVFMVMLTVAVCHCRVHKTYRRCFKMASAMQPTSPSSSRLCPPLATEREKASSRSLPHTDNSDMYYTLDLSDSQSSPLIQ